MVLRRRALTLLLSLALPVPALAGELPGVVRMSRADYDRLKDAAEKASLEPVRRPAAVPPSVESASYELRVSPDRIALELTADVLVKAPAVDARVALPPSGLLDALSDAGPAAVGVVHEKGRLALVFPKAGRYRVGARFLPEETRAEGQRSVDFSVLSAAAARLTGFGTDSLLVSVSGAPPEPLAAAVARPLPASASVRAVVKAPVRLQPSEKALVLCDTVDVLRVERDRVAQRVFVRVSVTRGVVSELALVVGKGAEVASLTGPADATHAVAEGGRIRVAFAKPIGGDHVLSLLLSRPAPGEDGRVELEPTRVEGAASSRSFVLVEPNPLRSQETIREATSALSRVDTEDLPAVALAFAGPGTRAYRVTGGGARLALAAPAREVIAPPDTLLRVADLLTVLGDGGARVDRRTLSFETRLPHLDLPIPAGEEVLAVAVDGAPAVPRVDGTSLVVALPPSAASRRTVDVTTKAAASVPAKKGELTLTQPPLPGAALLAKWTIVLPDDRRYRVERTDGIARVQWTRDAPVAAPRGDAQEGSWVGAQNVAPSPATRPSASPASATLGVRVFAEPDGAPLPGVTVEVRGPSGTTTLVTDVEGRAAARNLPPGRYRVRTSLAGFNSVERVETLSPGAALTISENLDLATVEESVVVSGTSAPRPRRERAAAPEPRPAAPVEPFQPDGVEGGVEGGVLGGVIGGVPGAAPAEGDVAQLSEKVQAGGRSLAMEVTGFGKRLLLSGPLVGGRPVSVTLSVKPD